MFNQSAESSTCITPSSFCRFSGLPLAIMLGMAAVGSCSRAEAYDAGETTQFVRSGQRARTIPLPSFEGAPNIQAAFAGLPSETAVGAIAATQSGLQIYTCMDTATGRAWVLRTPLATLAKSEVRRGDREAFRELASAYHYRSDFGGLLSPQQRDSLGLMSPDGSIANAPVWDFTFRSGGEARREVVAGRVLAQDDGGLGNIPLLLIEVRGRSVTPGKATAIGAASHLLRWDVVGGRAPDVSSCRPDNLGEDRQVPYSASYYFLTSGD